LEYNRENWELAEKRAEQYAPRPKYQPFQMGVLGFMTVAIVLALFIPLAGINSEAVFLPASIVEAIGFAAPYLYGRSLVKQNSRAFFLEYESLQKKSGP
jgi:hypothetical protein